MSAKDTFHNQVRCALPNSARELLLEEKDFRHILREFHTRLIFYDPQEEEALEWIEPTNLELL